MNRILKFLFFALIVKPLVYVGLGVNIRNSEFLPSKGPAIIAANHNSHLDTLVLMSLLPLKKVLSICPVAAADYFLKNKLLGWFFINIIGIIPVNRGYKNTNKEFFTKIQEKLDKGKIIIIYPEGSRGEPEAMCELKRGIAHIAKNNPNIPIIPVYIHGLGKALPKGEGLLVPFICDVYVGKAQYWENSIDCFMEKLKNSFQELKNQHHIAT